MKGERMILDSIRLLEQKYHDKICDKRLEYGSFIHTRETNDSDIYNWFPLTQRFSSSFLDILFRHKELRLAKIILDPFMGCGNTLVECLKHGKIGYGVDISELFWFITCVKTKEYSERDFNEAINAIANVNFSTFDNVEIPPFSSFKRLFTKGQISKLYALKKIANELNDNAKELLLFATVSKLLDFSKAVRYGKGLHKKRNYKPVKGVKNIYLKLINMARSYKDFRKSMKRGGMANPLLGDARDLNKLINPIDRRTYSLPEKKVDLILTSPPYCNSSDYAEMYKLEHWFLDFVRSYDEFERLSYSTIRSHLSISDTNIRWKNTVIEDICSNLENNNNLWNKKIPTMIRCYFDDLHKSIRQLVRIINPYGYLYVVVGNSCYGKIPIPTDLLLAEIATELGFKVARIEIARNLLTSGQQWKALCSQDKQLLRESIVILSPC
jgi:hypothetical protein